MPKTTAVLLVLLAAVVIAGTILVHWPGLRPPVEYRTIEIRGWTEQRPFGHRRDAAYETPNVANVLNNLRLEGWRPDRLVYVGESLLVVAVR